MFFLEHYEVFLTHLSLQPGSPTKLDNCVEVTPPLSSIKNV